MRGRDGDAFALIMKDGMVHRYVGDSVIFEDLDQARSEPGELVIAVPFRQALRSGRPASPVEGSARAHVSAIRVRHREEISLADFLGSDSCGDASPVHLADGHFDIDDEDYARRVAVVVDEEIRTGHGSNFVLHRTYRGRIPARTVRSDLSLYQALLRRESGAYWTFLVHFPDHSLVGASPELHLRRDAAGITTMNPISGTYRYPRSGPDEDSLRAFLQDPKERNELYMVVDEELKIMSDLCDERPWISAPQLRFMARLAHTEYLIHGCSSMPWATALSRSLVAPTVLGSPLESAYRMAYRNDASPRGYFGGVLAHVTPGGRGSFDSTILIRTACIEESGDVSIPVGSTIVRDSEPTLEAAETAAKAAGVLAAFAERPRDPLHQLASELLEERSADVATFWERGDRRDLDVLLPNRLSALVVDHEDRFTGMLAAHLRSLGLEVSVVTGRPTAEELAVADLLVLGPGPGDPNDALDPRIVAARDLARWVVETRRVPTLAVCLSHQLVCRELGLEVRRLPRPNQGSQRDIPLFGDRVRVGFYNSFSAYADGTQRAGIEVASDPTTGEVYAVRADGIFSVQFHPESVLSVDGAAVLRQAVLDLVARDSAVA